VVKCRSAYRKKLLVFGVVVIEDAKLTGKWATAIQFAKTIIEFQNPELKDKINTDLKDNSSFLMILYGGR